MSAARIFTLLVQDPGGRLLDPAGGVLLEGLAGPDALALRAALPPGARVQVVLAESRLGVQCVETPPLSARERRDVVQRLAREAGLGAGQALAHVLEADPLADGGQVLWLASCPRRELQAWLEALLEAGARPVQVLPWQRTVLAAGVPDHPAALYLVLEPGGARLLFFRGRSLRFVRAFPLPEGLDLQRPDAPALRGLSRLLGEELTLLLPFLRQKHRGAPPSGLFVVGLRAEACAALEGLELTPAALAPDWLPFLLAGAERERSGRAGLDLLPEELRNAGQLRWFRGLVRAGVAVSLLLGAGAKVFLLKHERALTQEALQAEASAAKRLALARARDEAARLRFGLLRLRRAEERQKQATEQLEQLGVRLFQVPDGVALTQVELGQEPGGDLVQRLQVEGTARTGRLFSLGCLASYYHHLQAHPGLKLDPLKDIQVTDGAAGEAALTRFTLRGTAP